MTTWTFELDGHKGRAERYGAKPLEVFIFWHTLSCLLSGTVEAFQQAVLIAEPK